ncbi:MAG: YceI family protein [Bacteroidia bacterium]
MTNSNNNKMGNRQCPFKLSFKSTTHDGVKRRGKFGKFDGKINTTEDDFTNAEIEINIESNSVLTGDDQRDGHLKSPDFFDAENHKNITFRSTSMQKKSDDLYELKGDLTIKGVTKPVTFQVEHGGILKDPWGNEKAGFTLNGKINRKDWNLNWNTVLEAGGVLVGEEVALTADVELAKVK